MTVNTRNILRSAILPIIATASVATMSAPVRAAEVVQTFRISASGFEAGAPISTVTGTFGFAYDNAKFRFVPSATGLTISNFNVPHAGIPKFTYQPNGDNLTVGDNIGFNSFTVGPNTPGFGFFLRGPSGVAPSSSGLLYSTGEGRIWRSSTFDVSAVPEPSSWAMLIVGFGLVGAALRRRQWHTAAARA